MLAKTFTNQSEIVSDFLAKGMLKNLDFATIIVSNPKYRVAISISVISKF